MCFDGVARVSRAAAQLAFFVAVALDVYQGKAILERVHRLVVS